MYIYIYILLCTFIYSVVYSKWPTNCHTISACHGTQSGAVDHHAATRNGPSPSFVLCQA